jgi:hypothetical protein
VCDVPRLATAHRTAALAAAVGLALATAGCGTGTGQTASGSTASGSPEPSAAVTGGPTELPTFDPSSAVATYAQGFPADLFPMPEDATLLASSAQPAPASEGAKKAKAVAMTQVTLNLSSSRKTDQVIKQAKQILTAQGFKQISAPDASGLTAQTAFLRITKGKSGEVQESLVVGVLDDGERRLCSISGTVRTP